MDVYDADGTYLSTESSAVTGTECSNNAPDQGGDWWCVGAPACHQAGGHPSILVS